MKLVSVNVGLPRDVEWRGETVRGWRGHFRKVLENAGAA